MRSIGLSLIAISLLASDVALANPIAMDIFRVMQVPGTHHVQLTYGVDPNMVTLVTPSEIKRDGVVLGGDWHDPGSTVTANTGSGLAEVAVAQYCDCDVSVGQHAYEITVTESGGTQSTRSYNFEVVDNLDEPGDAGAPGPDTMPWDIPEPPGIQGVDCAEICAASPPADAGPDNGFPGGEPPGGDIGGGEVTDRDGCSVAASPGGAGAALLLLCLVGLIRRRRR